MLLNKKYTLFYGIKSTYKDFIILSIFTTILFLSHHYTNYFTMFMPISISAFSGTAISLILSFNLAQSYDRWWEGRKIWGAIVNDSRSLALQLKRFTTEADAAKYKEIVKLQIVWNYAVVSMLRKNDIDVKSLKYLNNKDKKSFANAQHKPLWIYNKIQTKLKEFTSLNTYEQIQIDSTLTRLVAHMGKLERIKNTRFPMEYQLVLHASIYIFLAFLSLSLANLKHHWEIFMLIFIAVPFFLLEATAKHLQNPFEGLPPDVPMYSISRNIEINLLTLIEEPEIPQPIKSNSFYLN